MKKIQGILFFTGFAIAIVCFIFLAIDWQSHHQVTDTQKVWAAHSCVGIIMMCSLFFKIEQRDATNRRKALRIFLWFLFAGIITVTGACLLIWSKECYHQLSVTGVIGAVAFCGGLFVIFIWMIVGPPNSKP